MRGKSVNIGKISTVEKVYLSKKELMAYIGMSERYIETVINRNPDVELYRLSGRCVLYRKDNIDRVIQKARI